MNNYDTEWTKGYEAYGQYIDGEQTDYFWKGWNCAEGEKYAEDFRNELFKERCQGEP